MRLVAMIILGNNNRPVGLGSNNSPPPRRLRVVRPGVVSSSTVSFAAGASESASGPMQARIQRLEAAMEKGERRVKGMI